MTVLTNLQRFAFFALLFAGIILTGCDDDDVPDMEPEEEVITDVRLIFTNDADANDVVTAAAQDPDGEGVEELEVLGAINLAANTSYTLTFEMENNLETPGEDIAAEVEDEGDEHQIFFSFSTDAFTNPAGDGNIDNAADAVNYNDMDKDGNPIGLSSSWTTGATALNGGMFTARLQHQPDIKTSSTGANDGDSDFDLTFELNIQ